MARKEIEWEHQKALCDWVKLQRLDIGFTVFDLLISIKNESYEKTDPKKPWQAGKRINRYKESGMKSGTPDLLFAYPCHGEHGLWIEMKSLVERLVITRLICSNDYALQVTVFIRVIHGKRQRILS